jgi:hypothetical protein
MRWFIALGGGVAAAFVGTVAGGLIKPEAGSLAGQVGAPRMEMIRSGPRAATPQDDAEIDTFAPDQPDYVVGADWLPPAFEEDDSQHAEVEVEPAPLVTAAAPTPAAAPKPRALQSLAAAPPQLVRPAPAPEPVAGPLY